MDLNGDSFSDNALLTATYWIEHLMIGQVATAIAVIAVASMGFLALTGRVDIRRGAAIVLGCFIIFGAPSIARGLQSATSGSDSNSQIPGQNFVTAPQEVRADSPPRETPYDPYAGASVPSR